MDKLNEAIKMLGGVSAAARLIGASQSRVSNWLMRGTPVPAEFCPLFELHTKRKVTCEEMRPDVKWYVLRDGPRSMNAPAGDAAVSIQVTAAAPAAANDVALDAPGRA